jgi:hypothetical protein
MGLNHSFAVIWLSCSRSHSCSTLSFKVHLFCISSWWSNSDSKLTKRLRFFLQRHSFWEPSLLNWLYPLLLMLGPKSFFQPFLRVIDLLHILFKFSIVVHIFISLKLILKLKIKVTPFIRLLNVLVWWLYILGLDIVNGSLVHWGDVLCERLLFGCEACAWSTVWLRWGPKFFLREP